MNLINHIQKCISKIDLPHTFLLAVSGGSDSMVLLHAFQNLNISFHVAHVNYGFREEAVEEEALVVNFCIKNQIPLHILKLDGYKEMKQGDDQNLQNYARQKRYNFFHSILDAYHLNYIVTAHHALDNVETVLMNIFHSTSFLGLKGMEIVENKIFRPLLHVSKENIESFARENNIIYGIDKSNFSNDYKRNFIRNEIIPSIESKIPTIKQNFQQNLVQWNAVIHFYMQMIENHLKNLIKFDSEKNIYFFKYKKLLKNPFNTDIAQILLHKYHFNQNQVPELMKLFTAKNNGAFIQNNFYRLIKQNEFIYIIEKHSGAQDFVYDSISMEKLLKGETFRFTSNLGKIQIKFLKNVSQDELNFDAKNFYINADKMNFSEKLILRNVRKGDYFYPFGLNKKKKLSKYFIDLKIPIPLRNIQLVLTNETYILMVVPHSIDHRFACDNATKNVLHISIE